MDTRKTCIFRCEDLSVMLDIYDSSVLGMLGKKKSCELIHNLNLRLYRGEFLALVGSSGSGKTLMADALLGMFDAQGRVSGQIFYHEKAQSDKDLEHLRRHKIAYIPQNIDALDPLMTVGKQVRKMYKDKSFAGRIEARKRQQKLFERMGLKPEVAKLFPFELSGGMARRILICCALINKPEIIIADEPTPGIDEAYTRQFLQDLRDFTNEGGSVLLITHDVSLLLDYAHKLAIFRAGSIVEECSSNAFRGYDSLKHPFSRALWHALPEHGMNIDYALDAAEEAYLTGKHVRHE